MFATIVKLLQPKPQFDIDEDIRERSRRLRLRQVQFWNDPKHPRTLLEGAHYDSGPFVLRR